MEQDPVDVPGRPDRTAQVCAAVAAQEVLRDRARHAASIHGGKDAIKNPPLPPEIVLVVDAGHSATTATPVVEGGASRGRADVLRVGPWFTRTTAVLFFSER